MAGEGSSLPNEGVVPAIAWLEQSALLLLLGGVVVVGIGAGLWWRYTKESALAQ
jgi:hypothetical protein